MSTRPRFVSLFWDKAVGFWSKTIGSEVKVDVPCQKASSVRWIEARRPRGHRHHGDELSAAVRLVQQELDGIVVG